MKKFSSKHEAFINSYLLERELDDNLDDDDCDNDVQCTGFRSLNIVVDDVINANDEKVNSLDANEVYSLNVDEFNSPNIYVNNDHAE